MDRNCRHVCGRRSELIPGIISADLDLGDLAVR
jgi:hypothetical protein